MTPIPKGTPSGGGFLCSKKIGFLVYPILQSTYIHLQPRQQVYNDGLCMLRASELFGQEDSLQRTPEVLQVPSTPRWYTMSVPYSSAITESVTSCSNILRFLAGHFLSEFCTLLTIISIKGKTGNSIVQTKLLFLCHNFLGFRLFQGQVRLIEHWGANRSTLAPLNSRHCLVQYGLGGDTLLLKP